MSLSPCSTLFSLQPLSAICFVLSSHHNCHFVSHISLTAPPSWCVLSSLSLCDSNSLPGFTRLSVDCLAGRLILLPWFHPAAESIESQCSRCVNDVPLFGRHSALFSQIPISIAGCVITQHREAASRRVRVLVDGTLCEGYGERVGRNRTSEIKLALLQ